MQPSAETQKQLQMIDNFIFQLEISAHELELARQENEREALSVGLNYFDKDQKGAISPSECPELSARLFATLDVNHDGLISHHDLQQAIEQMTDDLEHKLQKIMALQREVEELKGKQAAGHTAEMVMVQIAQNEAMIEELKKDVEERKRVLQSIFHYFHTAFAMHVFGVTARHVEYRPADVRVLIKKLEKVEREANEDPLQVDEEVAGLRREEHARRLARAMAPEVVGGGGREWEKGDDRAQPQHQPQLTEQERRQRAAESFTPSFAQGAPELGGRRGGEGRGSTSSTSSSVPTWSGMATQESIRGVASRDTPTGMEMEKEKGGGGVVEGVTEKMKQWTGLGHQKEEGQGLGFEQREEGRGVGEKIQETMAGAKERVEEAWERVKESTTGSSQ